MKRGSDGAGLISDPKRAKGANLALRPKKGEPMSESVPRLGVKNVLFSWTDLFGNMRSKLVPALRAAEIAEDGAGFAGMAAHQDMEPSDPCVLAKPDEDKLVVLPWRKDVAWVPCELTCSGKPLQQCSRRALRTAMEKCQATHGLEMKTGIELEFHLLDIESANHKLSDAGDTAAKPCYAVAPLMRQYSFIAELVDSMEQMGWGPYQADHEDACGQFEINFDFDNALETADRCALYKWMAKDIGRKHGVKPTFMPKPFANLSGNSAHVHCSFWKDGSDKVMSGDGHKGLSDFAINFIGGLIKHAPGFAALTNPTVNSYKRINSAPTLSGASWSPNTISWTGNNRTHMIRVPDAPRFELRLADASANPYLMQAGLLAAGLDGVATKADPGPPSDFNMYTNPQERPKLVARNGELPLNLLDALRNLQKDKELTSAVGQEICDAYFNVRMEQWNEYMRHMSSWEIENTVDV